jgi:hypothetical protein
MYDWNGPVRPFWSYIQIIRPGNALSIRYEAKARAGCLKGGILSAFGD